IPAMPVVMVTKITGPMIIFTSLMKASPSGFIASPVSGTKWPSSAPSTIAASTCTYRWRNGWRRSGLAMLPLGESVGGTGDFVAQLQVIGVTLGVERAGLDRGAYRAAGFLLVAAVAEAAVAGQCLDVLEGVLDGFLAGRLEFAHAGRVDQAGARGQRDQRAVGGGVAAAVVAGAHLAGLHLLDAEQGVGEGGFAGPRGADQDRGAAGLQPRRQGLRAGRVLGIHRHRRHVPGKGLVELRQRGVHRAR